MSETFWNKYPVRPAKYLAFFFSGVLAGILAVQMQEDAVVTGIFGEYFLNQYANLRINTGKLLNYVGRYRCGQYFLAVCCGALPAAQVLLGFLLFFLGMAWGTSLSISTIRLGLKGILICTAGIFPQFFFYLPAFGWIWMWAAYGGKSRKRYLILAVAGFVFLMFGIGTVTWINPLILQQILRKIS